MSNTWKKIKSRAKFGKYPTDRKIEDLLKKEQPLSLKDVVDKLQIPKTTALDNLKKLCYWEKVKQLNDKRYALSDYQPEEEKIKNLIIDRRRSLLNLRYPSIQEISVSIGRTPENIKETVYKIASSVGWEEPTEKDIKFTKVTFGILNSFLMAKYVTENTKFKNDQLFITPEIGAKMIGAEYDQPTNMVRVPLPSDNLKVQKVEECKSKKITKNEWERWQEKIKWSSVRGAINNLLFNKEDKIDYENWLREKINSDLQNLKVEIKFIQKGRVEIIDSLFFKTIANIVYSMRTK